MAPFRRWRIQNSASTRACARADVHVVHSRQHTPEPMFTSKYNRSPLTVHCSPQANKAPSSVDNTAFRERACEETIVLPIAGSKHQKQCGLQNPIGHV
eukprot:6893974-Pyramimonas_sp.AAC.1